ncbi:MAG: helix-turn-helix domain-containing protein [Deltaproteobacteria bacterium]|nr:helix-turn-helix domain-containing protein [Deltaproteobacteria bacterium]MBW2307252.1 helix-turn-helix domain-containing protein [Deltaproteobacteria bacterium]
MEKIFTTADVAKICGVNVTTIRRWIEAGDLKAMKTPGKHSRISKSHLIDFLNLYNFPIPVFLQDKLNFVIIAKDPQALRFLEEECKKQFPGHQVHIYSSGYDALILLKQLNPDIVFIETMLPDIDAVEMCRAIQRNLQDPPIKIIAFFLSPSRRIQKKMEEANVRSFLFWPTTPEAFRNATMIS